MKLTTSLARLPLFLMLLCAAGAGPALSQGEHARRAAAELLVLLGDARALAASPAPSDMHQAGLRDRLRGGLSSLGILMRLADQEQGRPPRKTHAILEKLNAMLNEKTYNGFIKNISDMSALYPLVATGLVPATATPMRLKRAKEIHETLCAGCHDEPDSEVERPAYNLFMQGKAVTQEEFTARMIVGVRGDRTTGLGNPLSDEELAGLISYYRSSRQ